MMCASIFKIDFQKLSSVKSTENNDSNQQSQKLIDRLENFMECVCASENIVY